MAVESGVATDVRVLVGGAGASALGIVLAASGSPTLGGVITLAGWLALVASVHRFGRGK